MMERTSGTSSSISDAQYRKKDDKAELRAELDKIRGSKPKNMPLTMMRIHQIHNKLNREADSEKTRMDLGI